jgi:hypothetical protein
MNRLRRLDDRTQHEYRGGRAGIGLSQMGTLPETCRGLVDAEMPGDGMDVQEPKDQQHDGNQAHDG